MSETLRDVAVDLAGQLANCEANAACDGPDSWEYRSEYFAEYMDRINAADAERTCCNVAADLAEFSCSECGCTGYLYHRDSIVRKMDRPRFCPACGAKVVGGDE